MKPAPGIPIEQQREEIVLAMALYGEARGEPERGKLAVAWVIKNRATKNGTTMKQEILRPFQFSSFNATDVNRVRLLSAWQTDPIAWMSCSTVVNMLPYTNDPTFGATHYYVVAQVTPAWGRGSPEWIERSQIGAHVFGNTA